MKKFSLLVVLLFFVFPKTLSATEINLSLSGSPDEWNADWTMSANVRVFVNGIPRATISAPNTRPLIGLWFFPIGNFHFSANSGDIVTIEMRKRTNSRTWMWTHPFYVISYEGTEATMVKAIPLLNMSDLPQGDIVHYSTSFRVTGHGESEVINNDEAESVSEECTGSTEEDGDPVNLFTGAFSMSATDLSLPGRGMNVEWTRTYSGNTRYKEGYTSELGTAWGCEYLDKLLNHENGDISYVASGRVDVFTYLDGVSWNNAAHHYMSLEHNATDKELILTTQGELKKVFHDFTIHDKAGRLKRYEDRFGNIISFEHTANLLTKIIDTYGREITIDHNSTGYITEITDFNNRKISYSYYINGDTDGKNGQLKDVKFPEVNGTSTGNDFAGANRKTTVYKYDVNASDETLKHNIVQVIDPKGQTYISNSYSSETDPAHFLYNRLMSQTYGNGTFQFHYEEINETIGSDTATLLVIVNDRRGLVTETRMNALGNPLSTRQYTGFANPGQVTTQNANRPSGKLRDSDPKFFEITKTYDSEGKLLVTSYPEGNSEETLYNTAATERHGEDNPATVSQLGCGCGGSLDTVNSYEDNYQLLKSTTDARGHTTIYFYDYEEATLGDLNGDGITNGTVGLLVKTQYETVTQGLAAQGGNQTISETFQYNAFGQITQKVDGGGDITTYTYFPENDPDGDGQDIIAGRDATTGGYLKEIIIDPAGLNLKTSYKYDRVGNVIEKTNARGFITTYEVNSLNQVVRTFSPQMHLFDSGKTYDKAFIYDANDNVVEIWTKHENSENDSLANTPGFNQAAFFETQFTYDILDNVLTKTVEVGNDPGFPNSSLTTTYEYDASENQTKVIHPNSDEDTIEYDERDLVFKTNIAANAVLPEETSSTQLNYDKNANLIQKINPNPNNIENYTYDEFDRAISHETVESSSTTNYTYDNNNNITEVSINGPWSTNKNITLLSRVETKFDELNRPYETIRHLFKHENGLGLQGGALTLAKSKIEYDKDSLVVQTVNPNNHSTLFEYDAADRNTKVTDAVGNIKENIYADNINITQVKTTEVNPDLSTDIFTLNYQYDELNRLRRTEDDLNNVTLIKLDSRGMTATITDAENNLNKHKFDGLGRNYDEQRQSVDNDFITLTKKWDARSRLIESIDGENRLTSFAYDKHNRLTLRTNADLTTRKYTYDVESNLIEFERENKEMIFSDYDGVNRLIEKRYHQPNDPNPTIQDQFHYNGLNALTLISEVGAHKIEYKRESRNLIVESSQSISIQPAKTFVMDYDAVGNITDMDYPGGRQVDFTNYTDIELLGQISTEGATIDYEYAGYGRVKKRDYSNGFSCEVEFDEIKRIQSMEHKRSSVIEVGFEETYDKVHNRRAEEFRDDASTRNHARVFELDKYYRVTGFIRELDPNDLADALNNFSTVDPTDGEDHEVLAYDDAGNMDAVTIEGVLNTVTNNNMNETEAFGNKRTNIQYDDNGRMLSYDADDGESYTLTWNLRDQLIKVEKTLNGGPIVETIAQYEYYPDGMRAKKRLGLISNELHYYGVGMNVHAMYTYSIASFPQERLFKEFIYDLSAEALAKAEGLAVPGGAMRSLDRPLVMFTPDERPSKRTLFYHANPRGDVYALSSSNGPIVERYEYSLFGETKILDASYNEISSSAVGNPFMFGGVYYDEETRYYQMRFRYYDPVIRKFLSRDPLEDDSLGNLYGFVENMPNVMVDPLGLFDINEYDQITNKTESFVRGAAVDSQGNIFRFPSGEGLRKRYIYTSQCGWLDRDHISETAKKIRDRANSLLEIRNRLLEEGLLDSPHWRKFRYARLPHTAGIGNFGTNSQTYDLSDSPNQLINQVVQSYVQAGYSNEARQYNLSLGNLLNDGTGFSFEDLPSNKFGSSVGRKMIQEGLNFEDALRQMLKKCVSKSEGPSYEDSRNLAMKMKKQGFFKNRKTNKTYFPVLFDSSGRVVR